MATKHMHVIQLMAEFIRDNHIPGFEDYWQEQDPEVTREQVYETLNHYAGPNFLDAIPATIEARTRGHQT